ncbi:hypothetical protein QR692_10355 [Lactococcus petauri]|uniref:hypothetical protein n=1 Tax=Lactococcus petauri TaxID=1940789 RepID=UPI002078AB29|nr:hypothetical protein [Lactococcus petauri]USI65385.1 hypothetical protein LMK05_11240 [Lactococcus petauri]USI67880.1 hypothetical protein LMK04_10475 [Lactococcus petauri]WJE12541.1 hypothetical protein QR692_10355 [Lactococcus petauri]
MLQDQGSTPCPCFKINKLLQGVGLKKEDLRTMKNYNGFEVEIPIFVENGFPQIGKVFGIQKENKIFHEQSFSYEEKKKNARDYDYYDFENEIENPLLIKDMKKFAEEYGFRYAELLLDVVSQTDKENWAYFSEDTATLAKDFLYYGDFSRVLMFKDPERNSETPVGYVQVRVLKNTTPNLLYKDIYHQVGLKGCELWEENAQLKAGSPLYVDVIAVKQEFQHNRNILKLIPGAMKDIIAEIHNTTHSPFDIYGVGVTAEGRKMCRMLGMQQVSEVVRTDCQSGQARTLFRAEYHDFITRLEKMTRGRRG